MEKKKIVKKKADQTTPDPSCSGGERVHKKPWQETQATSKDIEEFLNKYVILRHNTVTGQPEFRVPECDEFESLGMQYITGATPLDEWRSATEWHNVCDRFVNSLINMLSRQKDVSERVMWRVINSDYVPLYNPFETYLSRLPPWDGTTNHIMDLASTVTVKGGAEELLLFYACLRKWLVAMIAGWLDDDVVNQEILVLVGRQGIYKTTWFNSLLPPALERYFHSNTSFGNMTKDEVLKLSMYGLICCEELDTMKPSEMNRLKWAVTTTVTDERRAYAHYAERRSHIASYCGTGNNIQFIDDDTGTRRWLPFEVDSILSPRDHPSDHDAVFAQAYALYRQGFRYWFSERETQLMARHNERFEVAKEERDLISTYYRVPKPGEPSEFVSSSEILMHVGGLLAQRLTSNKLGRAMTALGFDGMRSHGRRGYRVVAFTPEQVKANKSMLACDAKPDSEASTVTMEEICDTFDTLF
ncbi:MAG: hypothetical protein IKO86_07135 [Prevotella sp.]|nr:hypothetical protein [Prevotella sp.]